MIRLDAKDQIFDEFLWPEIESNPTLLGRPLT